MIKAGSSTGAGNPPGKHSSSYASSMKTSSGHFVDSKAFRGNMSVGRNASAKVVGMQPKQKKSSELKMRVNALP